MIYPNNLTNKTNQMTEISKIDKLLKDINKTYGEGAALKLGDAPEYNIESFSTGSLALDIALNVGGFPRGRITEVYGPESSGKTTLAIHAIADAQKKGHTALFIDAEHAFDPHYARNLGVDTDNLIFSQPDSGEQALEIAQKFVDSGEIGIVVVDSVAALTPQSEIDGEMGDNAVGKQAKLMAQAMRKLTPSIRRNNCAAIFINQLREKIGVMYGSPETTPGGKSLKFYASVRLDIRRIGSIKEKEEIVGNRTRVKIVKSKVGSPFKKVEFDIMYGKGISKLGEVIDLGVEAGLIKKSGSWYSSADDVKLGQGKNNVLAFFEDNPEYAEELTNKVVEAYS